MANEPSNITPAGKTYTVVKGDSLSKIAKRLLATPPQPHGAKKLPLRKVLRRQSRASKLTKS